MNDISDVDRVRLEALERYGILDTEPEPGFEDLVLLATRICRTPVSLISLVDEDRQWFKARIGFPACETPLSQSVCAHALLQDEVLIIPDLTLDERTRNNTLVTGEPHIRFYAGALLTNAEGTSIGTLCVIDTKPRPAGLSAEEADSLKALARQVMDQMELRRVLAQRDTALQAAAAADAAFKQGQELRLRELDHRLKNMLAIVQSIVTQSFRNSTDLEEVREALTHRILALARAQDILLNDPSEKTELSEIVRGVLMPHGAETQFSVEGPGIQIGPKAALSLSLTIHELATNATKYGALSTPAGRVVIQWSVSGADPRFTLAWRESGGPKITAPTHVGFGTRLVKAAFASEVGGSVTMDYPEDGFEFVLDAPAPNLLDSL